MAFGREIRGLPAGPRGRRVGGSPSPPSVREGYHGIRLAAAVGSPDVHHPAGLFVGVSVATANAGKFASIAAGRPIQIDRTGEGRKMLGIRSRSTLPAGAAGTNHAPRFNFAAVDRANVYAALGSVRAAVFAFPLIGHSLDFVACHFSGSSFGW